MKENHSMTIAQQLDNFHLDIRTNKWLRYFTIATRILLAAGFLPSGLVKIMGDRFTVLTTMHPMGHFLDAVYRTGFYYTLIGITQIAAAILLLIPPTALLGAILYFPIILNICLVSISVRFEGSLFTSTLMVLANLYLLFWDYHRLKMIFPWNDLLAKQLIPQRTNNKFPFPIAAIVITTVLVVALLALKGFDIKPRNTIKDCMGDCPDNKNPQACVIFCDCIHKQGQSLDSCLKLYYRSAKSAR